MTNEVFSFFPRWVSAKPLGYCTLKSSVQPVNCVLDLPGVEIVLFTAAYMCFRWLTKTSIDNTLLFQLLLCSPKAFSLSHFAIPVSQLGVANRLGKDKAPGQLSQIDQYDVPAKLGEGGFLKQLLLRDWLGIGLLVMSNCFCIICFSGWRRGVPFFLHLNLLYLNPQGFFFLPLPFNFQPHPVGRG